MGKIISQVSKAINKTFSVEDGNNRLPVMALHCTIDAGGASLRLETFDDALAQAHQAELDPLIADFRAQAEALAAAEGKRLP